MTQNIQQINQKQQKITSKYSPLRFVGIFSFVLLFTVLLIVATFTRVKVLNFLQPLLAIIHPDFFPDVASAFALKPYYYIPQIPVLLFSVVLLGAACTMTSAFFYIVLGLAVIPVFGLGGGFDYVLEPTFGYILAFIPASLFAGGIIYKNCNVKKMFKATLTAVLLIHILGLFYMLLVLVLKHEHFSYIVDWLFFESFTRAIYDLIFGFLAMLIAKFCKKFTWIITSL